MSRAYRMPDALIIERLAKGASAESVANALGVRVEHCLALQRTLRTAKPAQHTKPKPRVRGVGA
jgi:hypothetical protein